MKAVDLFCGSGGLSTGLIDSGIEVVAAFDAWEPAVSTYRRNLSSHAKVVDLSNVKNSVELIHDFDAELIAGGPPCQDFSTAGKRIESGNANLTIAFGNIVAKCRPAYFLMENVPQARLSKSYSISKGKLEQAGYEIGEVTLNAAYCGVPQSRRRFFAFGSLRRGAGDAQRFLISIKERLKKYPMTIKEYMGRDINVEHYYRHPRNYSRRSVFSVHEPSPTIRGVNRPVPPNYQGNRLDSVPPSTVRPLTSQERSRIQTFPASWEWSGGDRNANVETQIGNAVPVGLAAFVGEGIQDAAQ